MNLQAVQYSDGSVVIKTSEVFGHEVTGYGSPHVVVAGAFNGGPDVLLWPVADLERNTTECSMQDADYVISAFGGVDALNLAIDSFFRIRLSRKFE